MEAQKIKIEFETTPEMAMFISMYLITTAEGYFFLQKNLTDKGVKIIGDIAQNIIDQVAKKTDFDNLRLRNILISLRQKEDLTNFPNGLLDLLN